MGGPALLPGTVPPPKQRRLLPWTQAATLPVPKPARTFPRRRGQDPFADIVAGLQNLIQNIGKGAHLHPNPMTICCSVGRAHLMLWYAYRTKVRPGAVKWLLGFCCTLRLSESC